MGVHYLLSQKSPPAALIAVCFRKIGVRDHFQAPDVKTVQNKEYLPLIKIPPLSKERVVLFVAHAPAMAGFMSIPSR
jgi:hypothetical protein